MTETPHLSSIEPESPRYATDLVFVHGLWADPGLWARVAGAMAHRGWRCHLLDVRAAAAAGEATRGSGRNRGLSGWSAAVAGVLRGLPAPAILVGHDVGGLVALALAAGGGLRAAVAVAPLVEGARAVAPPVERLRLRLFGGVLPPPAPGHPSFAGLSTEAVARLGASLRPEPARLLASLRGAMLAPGEPVVPTLVVAQQADALVAPFAAEVLARGIGADFLLLEGGHWPMAGERSDAWASRIHRWIIQRVGGLLLLSGDEDLREE
ncbi:MAG: Serine aminopeptidase [Pseudomonadota bacterium]